MGQDQNILNELSELESSLAGVSPATPYQVPAGYFESLVAQVLARIKTLKDDNVQAELLSLSPILADASREMPYAVPAGYFEGLEAGLVDSVVSSQRPEQELEALSPLLAGLDKNMPYQVPAGYFENLHARALPVANPAAKVVPMGSRKWFRYAAAAVIAGVICTTVYLSIRSNTIDPAKDSYSWVKKNLSPVSTDEMKNFIQLTDETLVEKDVVATAGKSEEVKELMKEVSATDIQEFLSEIPVDESADDIMMN